jgi:hypothetical protein
MAYVPPHLRRRLQTAQDSSAPTQSTQWEQLTRSIKHILNKINRTNFQDICAEELFKPNLIRGRGLLCKELIHAVLDDPPIAGATDIIPLYSALIAVINSQLPNIGFMFVARIIERYERRLRIDVDKMNAKRTLELICSLANFYVIDFVHILEFIRVLFPSSPSSFVELLSHGSTNTLPRTVTMVQMCELSVIAFQSCAKLIQSESVDIYRELLNQFRNLLQEINAIEFIDDGDQNNNNNNNNNPKSNPKSVNRLLNRVTIPLHDSHYTRLRFSLETVLKHAADNFKSFPQFGEEVMNLEQEEALFGKQNINFEQNNQHNAQKEEEFPLNLVPTEMQISHKFDDITDTKSIAKACDKNADWFKNDPDYDLNEARWGYIRDIILGSREPLGDDGPLEEDIVTFKLDQLTDESPYSDYFSASSISENLNFKKFEHDNGDDNHHNTGFGGNTNINIIPIDPEVEAVKIRKSIYLTLQQSATAEETVHRFMKTLKTKYNTPEESKKYIRHVVLTLHDSMLARGVYEKDDGAIGAMLCSKRREFSMEFEDLFGLTCADIKNKKEKDTRILATFFADLLSQESITFLVFQYINLQVSNESISDPAAFSTRVFLRALLQQLRKNLSETKLVKVLTHFENIPYTTQLFNFKSPKEFINAIKMYNAAGLPLFSEQVQKSQFQFDQNYKNSAHNNQFDSNSDSSDSDSSDTNSDTNSDSSDSDSSHSNPSYSDSDSSSDSDTIRRHRYRRYSSSDSDSDSDHYRRSNRHDSSSSPPPPSSLYRRRDRSPPYNHPRGRSNSPPYRRNDNRSDSDDHQDHSHPRRQNRRRVSPQYSPRRDYSPRDNDSPPRQRDTRRSNDSDMDDRYDNYDDSRKGRKEDNPKQVKLNTSSFSNDDSHVLPQLERIEPVSTANSKRLRPDSANEECGDAFQARPRHE